MHWTARGAYLHLESSELIEASRGKNLRGRTREQRMKEEAADVLLVLMSISENAGIPWVEVEVQASQRCAELHCSADVDAANKRGLDDANATG